jgi:hypothetical protein
MEVILNNGDLLGLILAYLGDNEAKKVRLVGKLWAKVAMRYVISYNREVKGNMAARKLVLVDHWAGYQLYEASQLPNVDTIIICRYSALYFGIMGADNSLTALQKNNKGLTAKIMAIKTSHALSSSLSYYEGLRDIYILCGYFEHYYVPLLNSIPQKYNVYVHLAAINGYQISRLKRVVPRVEILAD